MTVPVGALERHIALIGFMGAGKTTIGKQVAVRTGRPFIDLDAEIERRHGPIPELFHRGEPEFRRIERAMAAEMLARSPSVIALGGGGFEAGRSDRALTVLLDVDVETAWRRSRETGRPLAEDEATFRRLFAERDYRSVADAVARDADDVLLASLGIELGAELDEPGAALIADEHVLQLHPREAGSTHVVRAKTLEEAERLWSELRIGRDGTIVGYGGGSTTDLAGFVAATYMRGVRWIGVPTTLVGQVDAAIGGKTAVDLPAGKNLVGAFHYPDRVVIEPALLSTLPERERRNGLAEVVKTGLLAGRSLWDLPEPEMIRACAAFKAAVCLSDPYEQKGRREILNLGHTFGHALETASDYELAHGEAVALGMKAALRLSGVPLPDVLDPEPVRLDRERAWAALQRDKKARDGKIRLVLLEGLGKPVVREADPGEVRAALDELIVD
jgi:shikimate kinase / 3-dehydroquinate synthase